MAEVALGRVRALDVLMLDDDVRSYLISLTGDAALSSPFDVMETFGPFLESAGSTGEALESACNDLYASLSQAGYIKPRDMMRASANGGRGGGSSSSAASSRAALGAFSAGGGQRGVDGSSSSGAGLRLLAAPVKAGAKASVDVASLDYLWGKEHNSFLNANSSFDGLEANDKKLQKKAAREAKKDDARSKYEKEKSEAEAAAAEAAELAAGAVSSAAVTYLLTESRKAQDIAIVGFNMGYGGALLLEGADLKISSGRRYGLVGRNGMGKSTLLRHMSRADIQGVGSTRFPRNIRVLHVEQEVAGDGVSVIDTVMGADVERARLVVEEAKLVAVLTGDGGASASEASSSSSTSSSSSSSSVSASTVSLSASSSSSSSSSSASSVMSSTSLESKESSSAESGRPVIDDIAAAEARLAEISARLLEIDAASAESRASGILAGLSFTTEMLAWPTKNLSGGWRMRVALACALFCEPDILLLDEPTNHIDAKSLLWLVDYLTSYPHTLLVVSHDRWFLNAICTDIIYLNNKKLDYYKGDYETFEKTRAERRRHSERAAENAEEKRAHIQSFIDKFRYNAKRASLVQSRIKALERMEVMEVEGEDGPKWKFEFPDPGVLGIPVLQISDVSFGYHAGRSLFRDVNFSVDLSSRIAIVGPNGVGKSTLLKLILGELEPQEGAVVRNPKLRIACFTQHHVNQLDLTVSPVDFMLRIFPGSKSDAVRAHLGSFGITGELGLQKMATMSGGQKSRVAFAVLTWKKPHLVILDEPTNNLDIETIDAVIVACANFTGGLMIVSHDQHFVESVCDEMFIVGSPPGRITKFAGEFKDYRKVAEREKPFIVSDGGEERRSKLQAEGASSSSSSNSASSS